MGNAPSDLNQQLAALHTAFRCGRVSEAQLAASAPFRQLVEGYVYGTFWRKYRDFIREQARNLDAEDLLTVAMIALLGAFRDYDAERGPALTSYLTMKMYQACHQEVRSNYERAHWKVSAPSPIQVISVDDDNPALESRCAARTALADPETELERAVILDAIDRLPAAYRQIVYLHHFEGRSFAEIGTILSPGEPVNKGTVKRRYDRALAALKPALEALGLGEAT